MSEIAQDSMHQAVQAFVGRWSPSGGAERANYQLFLSELCELLELPPPEPTVPDDDANAYVFERRVVFLNPDGSQSYGRIDLYKRGAFVLETKQGIEQQDEAIVLSAAGEERQRRRLKGHGKRGSSAWNDTLLRARGQAEQYARALAGKETRPPFLVVIDVGHTIDLYAEFTQTGGTYIPFPDPQSSRLRLADLAKEEIRERLRAVWLDPLSLDPARRSAKVTREIAAKLAELAKSLEAAKHNPHDVAQFLMRCLFTMFAEDVELIPKHGFRDLLNKLDGPESFQHEVEDLWQKMNVGGYSIHFHKKLLQFNGGLFYDPSALAVTRDQLDLLIEAAKADWRDVEPAIFGTLLERALDPVERHKLGAHYTPRAYVERLVMPTVIEPIRAEWDAVKAAAILHAQSGDRKAAVQELEAFHDRLCDIRVLDPACGTGNFLYVTLEHLKRIEGEIFTTYQSIAERQTLLESGHTVDPHQLLGIEINPRAVAIADLVLWIGYLQWHYRTRGNVNPPEPVLKNFKNIECRDALLTWSSTEPQLDEYGKPVTRWDGRTTKPHPVTGEEVPDETARVLSLKYNNPKKAEWPKADFVVGNPPFVGTARMREALGDGYTETLRTIYDELPESCDYVMFWWHKAATLLRAEKIKRFGFIATNSLRQTFNRRVIEPHFQGDSPLSIIFAIPDHPWVDAELGAAVRISMTVCKAGQLDGLRLTSINETDNDDGSAFVEFEVETGRISEDLRTGAQLTSVSDIVANSKLSCRGMTLSGKGFLLTSEEADKFAKSEKSGVAEYMKPFLGGIDIAREPRNLFVIDFFGFEENEVKRRFPFAYQHLLNRVKPEREQNNRQSYKDRWWIFAEPRASFRPALKGIKCVIATPRTAKHRFFEFRPVLTVPESEVVVVALDSPFHLAVLSSSIHVAWALAQGATLEDRPRYNNSRCFETFPFPNADINQISRIRELGEQLDAHRKRQQELHPKLTMTGMYNVLEKLRSGERLSAKEQTIHEQGLVSVLRQIHDELDAAVAEAYGWPVDLSDEEILSRLVALNQERAEEEGRGIVRWLRPEFQNPSGQQQKAIAVAEQPVAEMKKTAAAKAKKRSWPKTLSAQAGAVHAALVELGRGASAKDVAKCFGTANAKRVELIEELLETLETLGKAREIGDGSFVAT